MTLSVVEGHFRIISLFKCDVFTVVVHCAVPLHLQSFS